MLIFCTGWRTVVVMGGEEAKILEVARGQGPPWRGRNCIHPPPLPPQMQTAQNCNSLHCHCWPCLHSPAHITSRLLGETLLFSHFTLSTSDKSYSSLYVCNWCSFLHLKIPRHTTNRAQSSLALIAFIIPDQIYLVVGSQVWKEEGAKRQTLSGRQKWLGTAADGCGPVLHWRDAGAADFFYTVGDE